MPPIPELTLLIGVGLTAGVLGGLLGIGGSIVMIPALTLILGKDQQLAQASAMIVNVFVAAPAVLRHRAAKAIPWSMALRMLPAALVMIIVGVVASNHIPSDWLQRVFGVFLLYVIWANLKKLRAAQNDAVPSEIRTTWPRGTVVGSVMGFSAGLLGIGGGVITVPLLQRVAHLPLRRCIACSATAMCLTAPIGATRKNLALDDLGLSASDSVTIALCLAPTAIIGGLIGATLTHRLPVRQVRIALIVLLSVASVKYLTG